MGTIRTMDITPRIPQLAASREQVLNLMGASSTVACFGSRALLSLFVCAAPEPASVVGAVTTEAEALELIARHQPGFLFVTEHLEAGSGLGLVKQAHGLCPGLRTLLILQSSRLNYCRTRWRLGAMAWWWKAIWRREPWWTPFAPWWEALLATSRGEGPEPLTSPKWSMAAKQRQQSSDWQSSQRPAECSR